MAFSILIPTLNEEDYIGKLLVALKDQTFKQFEIIIVDCKSKDKTVKKIQEVKGKLRLKVLTTKRKGASYQRNVAAKHARYDNLIFLDADVIPERKFLEKIEKEIKKRHVDFGTVPNLPISNDISDKLIFGILNGMVSASEFIVPAANGTCIYVTKKAFFAVNGFDEDAFWGEDNDLARRLHKGGFTFKFFRTTKIFVSVRRIRKDGRFKVIKNFIKGTLHVYAKGPVKDKSKMKYDFGNF